MSWARRVLMCLIFGVQSADSCHSHDECHITQFCAIGGTCDARTECEQPHDAFDGVCPGARASFWVELFLANKTFSNCSVPAHPFVIWPRCRLDEQPMPWPGTTITPSGSNLAVLEVEAPTSSSVAADAVRRGQPVVYRAKTLQHNTLGSWEAYNWTYVSLQEKLSGVMLANTTVAMHGMPTLHSPDPVAPLGPYFRIHSSQHSVAMGAPELVARMRAADQGEAVPATGYLGPIPSLLARALQPNQELFVAEEDAQEEEQSLWLSSKGVRTHTHFDSDHNLFVQLLGTKRWYLYPPGAGPQLCPYPRLHPLWHKASYLFQEPDVSLCPAAADAGPPMVVELQPGDVLYVPPFWWHHVLSITSSMSLTTYSRARGIAEHMHAIYSHEHQFGAAQGGLCKGCVPVLCLCAMCYVLRPACCVLCLCM